MSDSTHTHSNSRKPLMPTKSIYSIMSQFGKENLLGDHEKLRHNIQLSEWEFTVLSLLCERWDGSYMLLSRIRKKDNVLFYEDEVLSCISLEYLRSIVCKLRRIFTDNRIPVIIRNLNGLGYYLSSDRHSTPLQGTSEKSQNCPPSESGLLTDIDRASQKPAGAKDIKLEVLERSEAEVPKRPLTTEVPYLGCQRIGQEQFREDLMNYWEGRCPLTGISDGALLVASHIIPWSKLNADDPRRLDIYNGLLLSALWDAAFGKGLVTFCADGWPLFSDSLGDAARAELRRPEKPIPLETKHQDHLHWHRKNLFSRGLCSKVPRLTSRFSTSFFPKRATKTGIQKIRLI